MAITTLFIPGKNSPEDSFSSNLKASDEKQEENEEENNSVL